jgi:hypothetical protein
MPDVDPIIQALLGNRQYPTDDPIAGIQQPLQTPKLGMTPPPVNASPQPNQVMSGVGDLTGVNDAVKALRGQMTPEEQQGFAATAAFGLLPGAGELRPVAKAAEELAPPLYSAAAKAIQDAKLTKGTPEQWLGYLRNQPGVKQEELGYMGALPDKGQLSKEDMQSWANANQVQLKEVNKGQTLGSAPEFGEDRLPGETKFSQYQLPGGQNYHEMLMTLPDKRTPEYQELLNKKPGDLTYDENLQLGRGLPSNQQNFIGSHWDEPNVIAHARMNDRMIPDANGDPQKTLFLEELQSDWHQAGRKQGYQDQGFQSNIQDQINQSNARRDALETQRQSAHDDYVANGGADRLSKVSDLISQIKDESQVGNQLHAQLANPRTMGVVPDAPFKQTWPDLMLKRMVRHAAENGYDQLAWTPGDVQADRYDLSKQVNRIQYTPQSNDLNVWAKNDPPDRPSIWKSATPQQLPDIIGKEAAEKILAQSPQKDMLGIDRHNLEGLDLKVGGEGMRGFYDKMLVDKANAIGKKYGARVQPSSIDTGDYKVMQDSYSPPFRLESRNSPDIISRHNTADDAWAEAERLGQQKIHVLPITPELKRAALTKGFPMFAAGGLTAGGLAAGQGASDPNAQMLNALRGQVSQPTPQQ